VSCGSHANLGPPDASADAAAPTPCALRLAGPPIELLAFDQRHASAPQMIVLDPGSDSSPASVALQAFANASITGIPDDIEIARARVGRAWPDAAIDRAPQMLGELALGFAQMASPAPGALAVAWHREEIGVGRPQLRTFDAGSWSPGETAVLAMKGDAVLSLVPGAGGLGVVWRDLNAPGVGPVQPMIAVLDAKGSVVRGPIAAAGPVDYPGSAPALAWTGEKFLVVTGFDTCGPGAFACAPKSVVVATLGDASIDRVGAIGAIDPATSPGHVAAATYADRVWIAWSEGDAKDEKVPRTVRFAALDARGFPVVGPKTLATAAPVSTSVSISASEIGAVVAWAERGDPNAARSAIGASRIVVRRVALDGTPDDPIAIGATFVDAYGPPTTAAIAAPRGALVLWAGASATPNMPDVAWMARVDCAGP